MSEAELRKIAKVRLVKTETQRISCDVRVGEQSAVIMSNVESTAARGVPPRLCVIRARLSLRLYVQQVPDITKVIRGVGGCANGLKK